MGILYSKYFYNSHVLPIYPTVFFLGRRIISWNKNQSPGMIQIER